MNKNQETAEELKKEIKSKKKVYILNILLIFVILIGVMAYMMATEGPENLLNAFKSVNYWWLLAGFGCLVGVWLCETFNLQFLMKKIYPDQKVGNSFRNTMIGQLFNNITPFASGGQPMQAYEFAKDGRRSSDALSVLFVKFIITQIILILFTVVVVISQFKFFAGLFQDLVWIGVIGIVFNIGIVCVFFLAGINKNFVMRVARPIITGLGKIRIGKFRIIKDVDKKLSDFDESVSNFSRQFRAMGKDKKSILIVAFVCLIQEICYYAITYMVYKALGNGGTNFFQVVTTQAFLMLIMMVIPTPGAGLGAEGGFGLLFREIFKEGTLNMAILFWRIYVFYIPILVGALFMIRWKKIKEIKEKKRQDVISISRGNGSR